MKVIACVDDNFGMIFNERRTSRDREVIKDIMNNLDGKLWIRGFSEELFVDYMDKVMVDDNLFGKIGNEDICFIEDVTLSGMENDISEVILYKWNKKYPQDLGLELDLNYYELKESVDIQGYSHDVITRENYIKK